MRALLALSITTVIAFAVPAAADTDLVVLGPAAADPSVPATRLAQVKAVLDRTTIAPIGSTPIDTACLGEVACLAAAGTASGASRQAVAISVGVASKAGIALELVLVDISGKELLARRPTTIAEAKLSTQLGPALKKFLDEVPVERAKALFAEGNQHYTLGEFAQALADYKRAYRAKPLPGFLFNIAQCHRKLNQDQDAIAMYQSYLVGVPDAKNKAMVESLIAESRAKLADAQRLEEARREDEARREAARLAVERKKSEDAREAKEAEAAAAVERARIEAQREREREKLYDTHPARRWTLIAGGLGAGAMIAGGVFGLQARAAQVRFDDAGCGDPLRLLGQDALATCKDDRDLGKSRAVLANIFLGGGAALLATSVVIFVIDPGNLERPDAARAKVAISPTSVQLQVRW